MHERCDADHPPNIQAPHTLERTRRWRLVLGGSAEHDDTNEASLPPSDMAIDQALAQLYNTEQEGDRQGNLHRSAPNVAKWLSDIRTYFPTSVVRVMQQDALERLDLYQLLLEPTLLEAIEPDVHLLANLLTLQSVIPAQTKETARLVVQRVVDEILKKLQHPMQQAIRGSLNRTMRNRRPRHHDVDWHRTIRANLRHYQPDYQTLIPEQLIGYGYQRSALKHVLLCVDQSGSMATSVVYASIFAAVLASIPAITTQMVLFDTAVLDMSDRLTDPVDILFGSQLGGGTDINQALSYCQTLVQQPEDTILVLISDLYEGGDSSALVQRIGRLVASGVQMIALLALSDEGTPAFNHDLAAQLAPLGVPAFGCTPDQFPDLMATAINRADIHQWAASYGIT